jgi:hypothetical protein
MMLRASVASEFAGVETAAKRQMENSHESESTKRQLDCNHVIKPICVHSGDKPIQFGRTRPASEALSAARRASSFAQA